ncbi:MAG: DUF1641 domain-containing protein [Myxococcales bacterium]|nr:DUF1641 domain-containing protein [Myxococcales bacterium]
MAAPTQTFTKPSTAVAPTGALAGADAAIATLARLEERLATIERVAASLEPLAGVAATLPGAVAMFTDTLDGVAARLGDAGVDLDDRMRSVLRAVEVSTAPRAVHGLASLIESQLLEPSALAVVSQLAAALASPGDARPVGLWGAMRALRDPDVQRAVGFLLAVAREFGKHLAAGDVEACRDRLDAPDTRLLEGVS